MKKRLIIALSALFAITAAVVFADFEGIPRQRYVSRAERHKKRHSLCRERSEFSLTSGGIVSAVETVERGDVRFQLFPVVIVNSLVPPYRFYNAFDKLARRRSE